MNSRTIVLSDFDGTITNQDVGNVILRRFAGPERDRLETLWRSGAIGSVEAHQGAYGSIQATAADLAELVDTISVDGAFPAFAKDCRDQGVELAVVSDGFDLYIRPIMQAAGLTDLPVFANRMQNTPAGLEMAFPHGNPDCRRCANCKVGVLQWYRSRGLRIIYVGDGYSDRYPALLADAVFAKGHLAGLLDKLDAHYHPFTTFADVQAALPDLLVTDTLPPVTNADQAWDETTLPLACRVIHTPDFVDTPAAEAWVASGSKG